MVGKSDGGMMENASFSANLLSRLKNMRGKKSGILFGTILAGAICSVILFLFFVAIIGFILIAIIGVLVPYLMGLRRFLHIVVYGLALFVVLSFVFAGAYTHYVYLFPPHVSQDSSHNSTAGYYFKDGSVTPNQGDGNTVFSFTAQLYHPSSAPGNLTVYVVLANLLRAGPGLNETMTPVSNETLSGGVVLTNYVYNTTLSNKDLYQLQFKSNVSGVWILTTVTLSPWTSTPSNTFTTLIAPSFLYVFVSVFILFFAFELIMFLMVWSRHRRDKILKARLEKKREGEDGVRTASKASTPATERKAATRKEKFICTSCGTEVGKEDKQCPKCGEKFD